MRRAIMLAVSSVRERRGGPFGAVVVRDREVISEGTNRVTATNDPTAHAEVVAIRQACRKLGRFTLKDCVLFSSCEPCPMCLGAIYWARVGRLYFACTREDAASAGFDDSLLYDQLGLGAESRSLPSGQLLRQEGLEAFGAWEQWEGKIPY